MYIPESWFFQNLYTAKSLADGGYLKPFLESCGTLEVDSEDSYEVAWSGITSVFPHVCYYFNEKIEAESIVIFDSLIDEFGRLCRCYEEREGVSLGTSSLRASAEREIYSAFELYGYHYDYEFRLYCKGHGRDRMVVLIGCEFFGFDQFPAVLADVRNELEVQIRRIKKELQPNVIPLKRTKKKKWKEAA